ncbi:MAG: hypothetical protein Q8O88_03250 [bacterium]|nr:hypothetical protein [bacterium]
MKPLNIKRQMVTITLIIGVLAFIIGFLVILPAVKNIRQLKNDINSTQEFLEDQYEKTQKMRRSVHNLEDVIIKMKKFENISIRHGYELQIITELEKIATDHNIDQSLKAVLNKGNIKNSFLTDIPALLQNNDYYTFSFHSEGKYEDLLMYFKSIEELPYYFIINNLQFSHINGTLTSSLRFDAILFIIDKES